GAVERLAQHPLTGAGLQVAGREIVTRAIAEDILRRLGLAHIAGRAANDDHQLGLVIELLGLLLGYDDHATTAIERGVVLVEEDGLRRHRLAGLRSVPSVVEADANDFFRV